MRKIYCLIEALTRIYNNHIGTIGKNDPAKTTTLSTINEDIDLDNITGISGAGDEEDVDEVKKLNTHKTRKLHMILDIRISTP